MGDISAITSEVPDSQDPTFNQLETLDPQSLLVSEDRSLFPCLTIVYHPQLQRVGEQAIIGSLMAYSTIELSRRTPEFSHPGTAKLRPLRDPFLSRRPIKLERVDSDFISIEPQKGVHLQLDGDKVETFVDVPLEDLHRGVFLTLSKRIILLLH